MNVQDIKAPKSPASESRVGRFFRSLQQFTRPKLSQGKSTPCSSMLTIRIYASELQCMCRDAVRREDKETGGHLFGNFTGSGVPVVMLATLPGPKAVHNVASFRQDLEYCQTSSEFLLEHFGLCMVGRWHSHHQIGLCSPSGGDRDTARSILEKNDLPAFEETIVTHNPQDGTVHVHPYAFVPGDPFEERSANFVIIPGLSPIREAAFGCVVFPNREMSEWRFPMERIVVNGATLGSTPKIPDVLIQQIAELPLDVQRGTKIAMQDGAVSIELPLEGQARGIIGYAEDLPDHPAAVFTVRESFGPLYDATAVINSDNRPISLAVLRHRLLQHHQPGASHAPVQDLPRVAAPATPHVLAPSTAAAASEPAPKPVETKRGVAKRVFKKEVASLAGMGQEAKHRKNINPNRS